jgi:endonuclease/exonuclease/phosphatase family metal-dependent hydrolase
MKIMTLNINGYGSKHGSWIARKPLIGKAIREASPDVVALQAVRKEIRLAGGVNQAAQVATAVSGFPYVAFEPASLAVDGSAEGLAFLGKNAPLETSGLRLSLPQVAEDPARRMVFQGLFRPNGQTLRVFNAHFSWIPEQNEANLREALAFLRTYEGPAVLVGDFNAPPDAASLALLAKEGWTDLWANLKEGDPGFTFEADEPDRRIDFIWANREAAERVRSIEVLRAPENDEGNRLSDHLGLVATIE